MSADGQPDVVPVGFEFDGTYINVGGYRPALTRRHRNVGAGNTKVAIVIDDLVLLQPLIPRFLRIYGIAEEVAGPAPHLRITPKVSWSSNLDGKPFVDGGTFREP